MMSDWISWLVAAGAMVVLEIFSGTFYLLMIAIGLLAGALVAFLGLGAEFQVIAAALVGAIATISLRKSRLGATNKVQANRDPNVNLDIGQLIQINDWQNSSAGIHYARAQHRGALWDVAYTSNEVENGVLPLPGKYRIIEIRGSQLIVEREKT